MAVRQSQYDELYTDAATIRAGAGVYSRDGETLGVVTEVWAYVPPYGYVAKSQFAVADYGPIRGTAHLLTGADGYVQVAPRQRFRREDEQHLFFPLASIQDMAQDESLIVEHRRQESQDWFAGRPECLDMQRAGR